MAQCPEGTDIYTDDDKTGGVIKYRFYEIEAFSNGVCETYPSSPIIEFYDGTLSDSTSSGKKTCFRIKAGEYACWDRKYRLKEDIVIDYTHFWYNEDMVWTYIRSELTEQCAAYARPIADAQYSEDTPEWRQAYKAAYQEKYAELTTNWSDKEAAYVARNTAKYRANLLLSLAGRDFGVYIGDWYCDGDKVIRPGIYVYLFDGITGESIRPVTERRVRCLGGFHTLCADAGELQNHPLSGKVAGEILPNSVWCDNFRPACKNPSGMTYIRETDSWIDIYRASGDLDSPKSAYRGYGISNCSQTVFSTSLANVGKRLPTREEFQCAAMGSQNGASWFASAVARTSYSPTNQYYTLYYRAKPQGASPESTGSWVRSWDLNVGDTILVNGKTNNYTAWDIVGAGVVARYNDGMSDVSLEPESSVTSLYRTRMVSSIGCEEMCGMSHWLTLEGTFCDADDGYINNAVDTVAFTKETGVLGSYCEEMAGLAAGGPTQTNYWDTIVNTKSVDVSTGPLGLISFRDPGKKTAYFATNDQYGPGPFFGRGACACVRKYPRRRLYDYFRLNPVDGADTTFTLTINGGSQFEISTDGGDTWERIYTGHNFAISDKVAMIRAVPGRINPTVGLQVSSSGGRFSVAGNMMSLIRSDFHRRNVEPKFADLSSASHACFSMFAGCTNLYDASALIIPFQNVPPHGYEQMFYGCTGLRNPPVLYGSMDQQLSNSCYQSMFEGCMRLCTAPDLPSTKLDASCYTRMFAGCIRLSKAPDLPASVLANYCYAGMFSGCYCLGLDRHQANNPPKYGLPEMHAQPSLATACYEGMFGGVSVFNKRAASTGRAGDTADMLDYVGTYTNDVTLSDIGVGFDADGNGSIIVASLGRIACWVNESIRADTSQIWNFLEVARPSGWAGAYSDSTVYLPSYYFGHTGALQEDCFRNMFAGSCAVATRMNPESGDYGLPIVLRDTETATDCYERMFADITVSGGDLVFSFEGVWNGHQHLEVTTYQTSFSNAEDFASYKNLRLRCKWSALGSLYDPIKDQFASGTNTYIPGTYVSYPSGDDVTHGIALMSDTTGISFIDKVRVALQSSFQKFCSWRGGRGDVCLSASEYDDPGDDGLGAPRPDVSTPGFVTAWMFDINDGDQTVDVVAYAKIHADEGSLLGFFTEDQDYTLTDSIPFPGLPTDGTDGYIPGSSPDLDTSGSWFHITHTVVADNSAQLYAWYASYFMLYDECRGDFTQTETSAAATTTDAAIRALEFIKRSSGKFIWRAFGLGRRIFSYTGGRDYNNGMSVVLRAELFDLDIEAEGFSPCSSDSDTVEAAMGDRLGVWTNLENIEFDIDNRNLHSFGLLRVEEVYALEFQAAEPEDSTDSTDSTDAGPEQVIVSFNTNFPLKFHSNTASGGDYKENPPSDSARYENEINGEASYDLRYRFQYSKASGLLPPGIVWEDLRLSSTSGDRLAYEYIYLDPGERVMLRAAPREHQENESVYGMQFFNGPLGQEVAKYLMAPVKDAEGHPVVNEHGAVVYEPVASGSQIRYHWFEFRGKATVAGATDALVATYGTPHALKVAGGASQWQAVYLDKIDWRYEFFGLFRRCKDMDVARDYYGTVLLDIDTFRSGGVSAHCYRAMFSGCGSLTRHPVIPYDRGTLTIDRCAYKDMFSDCTELPYVNFGAFTASYGNDRVVKYSQYCFQGMFKNCTGLNSSHSVDLIISGDPIGLFMDTFNGCTHITYALPISAYYNLEESGSTTRATAVSMFAGMFAGCTSLVTAPEMTFRVRTLGSSCFQGMFKDCTSLQYGYNAVRSFSKTVTKHDVDPGQGSGYDRLFVGPSAFAEMFMGCTSLEDIGFYGLFGDKVIEYGAGACKSMFEGCEKLAVLRTYPELEFYVSSANHKPVQFGSEAFSRMYFGCETLALPNNSDVPPLPAPTVSGCYSQMFEGCSSLKHTLLMQSGTSIDAAPLSCARMYAHSGVEYIHAGLNSGPYAYLQYRSFGSRCFESMFEGCANLSGDLSANNQQFVTITLKDACNAASRGEDALKRMFAGCDSITGSPYLNCLLLPDMCEQMFQGCSSLSKVMTSQIGFISDCVADAEIRGNGSQWLDGVSLTGIFLCPESMCVPSTGSQDLGKILRGDGFCPEGWNVEVGTFSYCYVSAAPESGASGTVAVSSKWGVRFTDEHGEVVSEDRSATGEYNQAYNAYVVSAPYLSEVTLEAMADPVSALNRWEYYLGSYQFLSSDYTYRFIAEGYLYGATIQAVFIPALTLELDPASPHTGQCTISLLCVEDTHPNFNDSGYGTPTTVGHSMATSLEFSTGTAWEPAGDQDSCDSEDFTGGIAWPDENGVVEGQIPLAAGGKICLRAGCGYVGSLGEYQTVKHENGNVIVTGFRFAVSPSNAKLKISGNILSLLRYDDQSDYAFAGIFRYLDATFNLTLPDPLYAYYYQGLFFGCKLTGIGTQVNPLTLSNLLTEGCYSSLFEGCENLTLAPILPATTLVKHCYESMFRGCSSLKNAPEIQDVDFTFKLYSSDNQTLCRMIPEGPYDNMFRACASLELIVSHQKSFGIFYDTTNDNWITWERHYAYIGNNWVAGVPGNVSGGPVRRFICDSDEDLGPRIIAGPDESRPYSKGVEYLGFSDGGVPVGWYVGFPFTVSVGVYPLMTGRIEFVSGATKVEDSDDQEHEILGPYTANDDETYTGATVNVYSSEQLVLRAVPDTGGKFVSWRVLRRDSGMSYYEPLDPEVGYDESTGTYTLTLTLTGNETSIEARFEAAGLCFTSADPNATLSLVKYKETTEELPDSSYPELHLEYSTDAENWADVAAGDMTAATSSGMRIWFRDKSSGFQRGFTNYVTKIPVIDDNTGDPVLDPSTGDPVMKSIYAFCGYKFEMTGNWYCHGDITDLVSVNIASYVTRWTYRRLFDGCSGLLCIPDFVFGYDPAQYAYNLMFRGCTGLTGTPRLPRIPTIPMMGLAGMFQDCTGITGSPEIASNRIGTMGCQDMFRGCASLVNPGDIVVPEVWNNGCQGMFQDCTALTHGPSRLTPTTIFKGCYQSMFEGCTRLESAPDLVATSFTHTEEIIPEGGGDAVEIDVIEPYCYSRMFLGCTSLKAAPALMFEDLAEGCCEYMFYGCVALEQVSAFRVPPATWEHEYQDERGNWHTEEVTTAFGDVPDRCFGQMYMANPDASVLASHIKCYKDMDAEDIAFERDRTGFIYKAFEITAKSYTRPNTEDVGDDKIKYSPGSFGQMFPYWLVTGSRNGGYTYTPRLFNGGDSDEFTTYYTDKKPS